MSLAKGPPRPWQVTYPDGHCSVTSWYCEQPSLTDASVTGIYWNLLGYAKVIAAGVFGGRGVPGRMASVAGDRPGGNMTMTEGAELVPARMVNGFAYCPRLFFLEWVDRL